MARSFTDPETEFRLERSETPVTEDGYKLGELTGTVICEVCGQEAGNIDAINHEPGCPQSDVVSDYWRETHPRSDRV
jgi:hypothetical protein